MNKISRHFKIIIFRLRNFKPKEYIFLHYKILILFVLIFLINLTFFSNSIKFNLKFLSLENAINTVEIVIRSVIVLLSIIISFILLSFQIQNKYFGRFAFANFFKKKHLRIIFTLFIIDVVFLIYVQTYLKDCLPDNDFDNYAKLIFTESVIFSVCLILSIFPLMINLLSKSQSRTNLEELFKGITLEEISNNSRFYNSDIDFNDYETNSFKIITEIGLNAIKDFDHNTFELIIRSIYSKFKIFLNADYYEDSKKDLFVKFRDILLDFFEYATKEKNTSALNKIVSCRNQMELQILKQETPILKDYDSKYKGWDFNFDFEKLFDRAILYNEDSICSSIVDYYRDYMGELIKIKFVNNFKYDFKNPYSDNHYTSIIFHNYSTINKFHTVAGQLKKNTILKNISNLFMTLDSYIVGSNNTNDTKSYLLQYNNEEKQSYLKSLIVDSNISNLESLQYPYGITLDEEIREMKTATIFRNSLKSFDFCFQKKVINNQIINNLKSDCMGFINSYDTNANIYTKLLTLAFDKIDYTRNLITKNDDDYNMDIYLKLNRFWGYISNHYIQSKIENLELKKRLDEITSNFEFVKYFEDTLDKKGYIQNKGLI